MLGLWVSWGVLLAVAALAGPPVRPAWLALPLVLAALQVLGCGVGLLLATVNVFFRDVQQVVAIALQLWFWLTPIVYALEDAPSVPPVLFALNPAWWYVEAVGGLFLEGRLPTPAQCAVMLGLLLVTWAAALAVFQRLRPQIRDVL
jgi:lipopolysaccharide transport system permease protein